jgi:2,3-bisphosphoglycerate-dependent phosphoglycerate mutase
MKPLSVLLLFIASLNAAIAQNQVTTFVLIRHAEKYLTQSTNDPDLSAEGKKRAQRLTAMFNEGEVTAIYSTPYKRTRQTVEPLATNKRLTVSEYSGNKEDEIDAMLKAHAGGTIIVVGHSNTIPWFANKLLGIEKYRPMEDDDYDNVWMVSVVEKGNAKLVWLNY